MKLLDQQYSSGSLKKMKEEKLLAEHWKSEQKRKQIHLDSRDKNSQLVVHGSKGNSRIIEAPK